MRSAIFVMLLGMLAPSATGGPATQPLELQCRRAGIISPTHWDPRKTAVVICDMWNDHWCKSAAGRVAEMAPRMNDVITALRDRGVLIIHCPSDTMKYYENHPGRKLAQSAPKVETKIPCCAGAKSIRKKRVRCPSMIRTMDALKVHRQRMSGSGAMRLTHCRSRMAMPSPTAPKLTI